MAINLKEDRDTVLKQVRSSGLSYMNLLDTDGTVSATYGVSSTPMKFIVDTKGNVVAAALGYREWDGDEMIRLVTALIESGS